MTRSSPFAALAPLWEQARAQWQANARLRAGLWLVLAIALAQGLLLVLDRVDARKQELEALRGEAQRLRAVPSAQAWGERAREADQALAAYQGMAWSEADIGLAEAALQDWLRTVSGRLGLGVRELTVARQQVLSGKAARALPPGHQALRARLVVDLQRTPLMAFLAELARSDRSIVVERLVWRGTAQPPLVEIELVALARDGGAKMKPLLLKTTGLLLAAGLGALVAPPLEAPKPLTQARQDDWVAPSLPRKPDQATQALALVGSPMFEPEAKSAAQQAAAAAPPPDERWRVAGLLGRGDERRVLISYSDPARASETLKVGDKLPSGHRIQRIEPSTVCVQVGRKILRIGVQARD